MGSIPDGALGSAQPLTNEYQGYLLGVKVASEQGRKSCHINVFTIYIFRKS